MQLTLILVLICYIVEYIIYFKLNKKILLTWVIFIVNVGILSLMISNRPSLGFENRLIIISVLLLFGVQMLIFTFKNGKSKGIKLIISLVLLSIMIVGTYNINKWNIFPRFFNDNAQYFTIMEANNKYHQQKEVLFFDRNMNLVGFQIPVYSNQYETMIYQDEDKLCIGDKQKQISGYDLKNKLPAKQECQQVNYSYFTPAKITTGKPMNYYQLGSKVQNEVNYKEQHVVANSDEKEYDLSPKNLKSVPYYIGFEYQSSSIVFRGLDGYTQNYTIPRNEYDLKHLTSPEVKIGQDNDNICINNNLVFNRKDLAKKLIKPRKQACETSYFLGENTFSINYSQGDVKQNLSKTNAVKLEHYNSIAYSNTEFVPAFEFPINNIANATVGDGQTMSIILQETGSGKINVSTNARINGQTVLIDQTLDKYPYLSAFGQDDQQICLGGEYVIKKTDLGKKGKIINKEKCKIDYALTINKDTY